MTDRVADKIGDLHGKVAKAIEIINRTTEENNILRERLKLVEEDIARKEEEIRRLTEEKDIVKSRIEKILGDIETIEMME